MEEAPDLLFAKQSLQFLKANRLSRLDTSRHLNLLMNPEAYTASEIGENAKILLKFVRLTERLSFEADKFRISLRRQKNNVLKRKTERMSDMGSMQFDIKKFDRSKSKASSGLDKI